MGAKLTDGRDYGDGEENGISKIPFGMRLVSISVDEPKTACVRQFVDYAPQALSGKVVPVSLEKLV